MPPQPRLDLAGVPQHIVQRGSDRQPCFFSDDDHHRYLGKLHEIALREGRAVHTYVVMTNHVNLLMTPAASGQAARVMQALGRRYVRHINDRYRRTGTLWEGRYKACLVDHETCLLRCYATSNSIRCARRWWRMPATTRGRALPATHWAFRTRWFGHTRRT